MRKAIKRIKAFRPSFLVVALGLDTAKGDPTGTWKLSANDFENNGRMIRKTYYPNFTVFVEVGV